MSWEGLEWIWLMMRKLQNNNQNIIISLLTVCSEVSGCGSEYEKSWTASSLTGSSSLLTIVVSGNFFRLVVGSMWGDAWLRL